MFEGLIPVPEPERQADEPAGGSQGAAETEEAPPQWAAPTSADPTALSDPNAGEPTEPAPPQAQHPPTPALLSSATLAWKAALRRDFEQWLATLDDIPRPQPADDDEWEALDLYSFYEQLAASNTESRKANRRTAEAVSQLGDTLGRVGQTLEPLREAVSRLTATRDGEDRLPRWLALWLIEMFDRIERLATAFRTESVKRPWWGGNDRPWRAAWGRQQRGFGILADHFCEFLTKQGLTRIEALGRPFDPEVMTAVATQPDAERPARTVIEELVAGYRLRGELLRLAQVKVTCEP